jgi:IS4 transposase
MVTKSMMDLFSQVSPVPVMVRAVLENILAEQRLNQLFLRVAERQYFRELSFSSCVQLMMQVVAQIRPSIHAAYQGAKREMAVSVTAVYDKLKRIEPAVSERLVSDTATSIRQVMEMLDAPVEGPLPGWNTRILDGNHLAGTEHRLRELRSLGAAALPGQTMPILDPQQKLIEDVIVCEDGHANERTLIPRVLEKVRENQCWIGDSSFSTMDFFFGVAERNACFLVRQHGALFGELQGKRKSIGRVENGMVCEQPLRIEHADGRAMTVRRVTIELDQPTQKGDSQVHLLTNLPAKVSAKKISRAYRQRWRIETAFQEVTTTLRSEVNTLGYPDAALFGFCVALLIYNVLSLIQTALRGSQTTRRVIRRHLSMYALAEEIAGVWRGMLIAIPVTAWKEAYGDLTPRELARELQSLARQTDLDRFTTHKWTPKQPQPKRQSGNRGNHVSTYKILEKRGILTP